MEKDTNKADDSLEESTDLTKQNSKILNNSGQSKNNGGPNSISYDPDALLTLEEVQELDNKYIVHTYDRMPICFPYGSGEFLYDSNGKEYIDFLSGIAVTALGHANADLINAISHQADRLWHSSNLFYNQQQAMLARALVEITFNGKLFFCNSGTEANEAALKLMRAWGEQNNQANEQEKNKVIALKGSFHGRTFGSMSMTGQEKVQQGFGDMLDNMIYVDANDTEQLTDAFNDDVCGFIAEPILGEGGVLPLSVEFLEKARELCDQHKALLIFDEIQTGMGRSGHYFAFQGYGVKPDAFTMAKGLGGGFPIGALLIDEKYTNVLGVGSHGSTFGGNPLASAVAYEVLRSMEANKTLENVNFISEYLRNHLENLRSGYPDKIKEIRGAGLMLGVVMDEKIQARPLVKKALEKKLVIGRAGENVIRLTPPLILREVTVDRAIERLEELIRNI